MNLQYYDDSPKCATVGSDCRNPSIKERLESQKQSLTAQLKRVNDALEALNANLEVLKVLELLSKV